MKTESIFDLGKSHVSAIHLYDALAEIFIFHLYDALAAESLGFTVGPDLAYGNLYSYARFAQLV